MVERRSGFGRSFFLFFHILLTHLKADTGDRVQSVEEVERGPVESQRLPDRDGGKHVARSDQIGGQARERGVLADEGFVYGPDQMGDKRIGPNEGLLVRCFVGKPEKNSRLMLERKNVHHRWFSALTRLKTAIGSVSGGHTYSQDIDSCAGAIGAAREKAVQIWASTTKRHRNALFHLVEIIFTCPSSRTF